MTEKEKIAQIKWLIEKHPSIRGDKDFTEPLKDAIRAFEENQAYKAIGTVEEFKTLKEKDKPKVTNISGDGYSDGHLVYDTYECPNCGKQYELEYEEHDYCPNCGQHMNIPTLI